MDPAEGEQIENFEQSKPGYTPKKQKSSEINQDPKVLQMADIALLGDARKNVEHMT